MIFQPLSCSKWLKVAKKSSLDVISRFFLKLNFKILTLFPFIACNFELKICQTVAGISMIISQFHKLSMINQFHIF